ncbi:MAG: Gfo/Idh/MocA family oxidoreductase [Opitutales bacterium]|nr:Gfo/Idh/MocA family oxidoreductase [Opitutales bacterium]
MDSIPRTEHRETKSVQCRWGVVGTHRIAQNFVRALMRVPGAKLAGICSRSREKGQAFLRSVDGAECVVYSTLDELCSSSGIDAVYIASPTKLHKDHCIAALEGGKAVLCEKPLAASGAEAREIAAAAQAANRFCMEAMWMRFSPLIQEAKRMVEAGSLGEVHFLRAEAGYAKQGEMLDRERKPGEGRGALLAFGVYAISLAHYILGKPDAISGAVLRISDDAGEDAFSASLRYGQNCLAVVSAHQTATLSNEATIVGEDGFIVVDSPFIGPSQMRVFSPHWRSPARGRVHRMVRQALARLMPARFPPANALCAEADAGLRGEALELMECVSDGRTQSDVMPLEASIEILDMIDAIRGSARV